MLITSSYIIFSVAEEDHSDADCLLVTVLTHGENSDVLYAYDCYYNVEDLWLPFTADKSLSLAGKPKIFIIQVSESVFFILIM
jgi:caspase-like apoptosis-related cysteine protease